MKLSEINSWWQKGMEKERKRHSNVPKPFKGDRFSVAEDFSDFAPSMKRMKRPHAR